MEMVVIIVVMSLAIPVLMTMWSNVAWRSARSETMTDAVFYGQELMEEIKSKRFDEKIAFPWTNSSNLTTDSGENSNNKATFDDIDDFVNATDPLVTAPAPNYIRSVNVSYVLLNSTNVWQPCSLPVTCSSPSVTDCSSCSQCCYKAITVITARTDNPLENVTLNTIISGR